MIFWIFFFVFGGFPIQFPNTTSEALNQEDSKFADPILWSVKKLFSLFQMQ
jgi:hypothetical protein